VSFALYTGMRRKDLDALDDSSVSPDLGWYRLCSRKTGDVAGTWQRMPEPLRDDCEAELRRLGRPWRQGEPICGGPWPRVAKVLRQACLDAGVSRVNLMDLRRSYAYLKASAGVPQDTLRRKMGHADSRMLDHVYRQFPTGSECEEHAWPEMRTRAPGTGSARIVSIAVGKGATPRSARVPHEDARRTAKPASFPVGEGGTGGAPMHLTSATSTPKRTPGG
jgi:integrase